MLNVLSSNRLIIVTILISLVFISTVVSQDMAKRWRRRHRKINCAIYVFAPKCRGVSAKRSSPSLNPSSFPSSRETMPQLYQLFQQSQQKGANSYNSLPELVLPKSYPRQTLSESNQMEKLPKQLHQHQQEEQQQQQQQAERQQPSYSLLQLLQRLLRQWNDLDTETKADRYQWRGNLMQDIMHNKQQQAHLEDTSDDLFPYQSDEDSRL